MWNISGFAASTYALSATTLPVPGETNLGNNSYGPVKLRKLSTGPTPSSSLTRFSLATEEVILISLAEAVVGLFFLGRKISSKQRKPVRRTKRSV